MDPGSAGRAEQVRLPGRPPRRPAGGRPPAGRPAHPIRGEPGGRRPARALRVPRRGAPGRGRAMDRHRPPPGRPGGDGPPPPAPGHRAGGPRRHPPGPRARRAAAARDRPRRARAGSPRRRPRAREGPDQPGPLDPPQPGPPRAAAPPLRRPLARSRRRAARGAGRDLRRRLAALARAAAGARERLDETFEPPAGAGRDPPRPGRGRAPRGASIAVADLERLPSALLPHALAFLHRRAGAPYPAGAAAREELARQLAESSARRHPPDAEPTAAAIPSERGVGCDAGGGWRWQVRSGRLLLLPPAPPLRDRGRRRSRILWRLRERFGSRSWA